MLVNFLQLNSEGLYQSSGKRKVVVLCLVFSSSTECEIGHFHVVVVQLMTAKKCTKKHDACACKVVVLLI